MFKYVTFEKKPNLRLKLFIDFMGHCITYRTKQNDKQKDMQGR